MRMRTRAATLQRRLTGAALLAAPLVTLIASLAGGGAAQAREAELRNVVKDPYYGDALFYFFEDRYFSSLTHLMVAQHFGRLSHHADEAEVLRGGLLLSFGLHREAGEIFERLIAQGAPPDVRDRAWFYLAKIRYQRGYAAQAEDALGRIAQSLPPDLQEDRALLLGNLMMARGDYAGAAKVLQTITSATPPAPNALAVSGSAYARYNLGVALVKSGDVARGTALLDQIGQAPATGEEMLALRDKANLALGFAALQNNDPAPARGYLERVRLTGMLASKALLGFGWAAAAQNQPKEALVPWTELAGRDPSDPAVLEAKLAVPYAMAQLGASAQALDLYNDAIGTYDRESAALDDSIAAIRAGKLLDGLLARNPGDEMGWFWNIRSLPQMPHAGHLALVLAQHEFQEAFKNYRDLQLMSRNLQEWQGSLVAFGDMLANRRQAYAERLPVIRSREHALGFTSLEQRRDALAGELAQVEAQADATAFPDARERALLDRLERVRATLLTVGGDAQFAEARERFRRVAGALQWQMNSEFPARLWDAKKRLADMQADIAKVRAQDAALLQAVRDEPARSDAFAARIVELDQRLHGLVPRVADLARAQREFVQELAVAELARQKDRLAVYSTQARFAVAQIYDRANSNRDADHAQKP